MRVQLMLRHPFLAAAIARLPLIDGTQMAWCATAATDGYSVFVDSDFFESLSDDEARFVLAHEYLHVILGHADRRRDRRRSVWNQATDYAINQTLVEFGFEMPESGLFAPRFRGESAEAIYEALIEEHRHEPQQRNGAVHSSEATDDVGLEGAAGRLDTALTATQRVRLVAAGGWDLQLEEADPETAGARDQRTPSELERRQLRVTLAAAMKSGAHGRRAGYLADEIEAAAEPYVSWEALLAQFMGGIRRSDYRTFPFNKKHVHRGLYLPTMGAPGPEHLVVALDTSGSVDDQLASAFLGEIDAIRSTGECRLTLLECDAQIEHVTVFEPWDEAFIDADGGRVRIHGRGGTSFTPPFTWVEKQAESGEAAPDALIYLTDGFGPFPTEQPEFPVLWVLSADGTPDGNVPFGAVIRLPRRV